LARFDGDWAVLADSLIPARFFASNGIVGAGARDAARRGDRWPALGGFAGPAPPGLPHPRRSWALRGFSGPFKGQIPRQLPRNSKDRFCHISRDRFPPDSEQFGHCYEMAVVCSFRGNLPWKAG
jgi:hypothetical protein